MRQGERQTMQAGPSKPTERHAVARIGWLRAAVLGANDGIVSTASLIVGVDAAESDKGGVLVAGIAGLVARGLDGELAKEVATQLMAKDALGTHLRDELGISDTLSARPVQAAIASAGTFAVGAALPLLLVPLVPATSLVWSVSGASLVFLAVLGGLAARVGGSPVFGSVARVTF